MKYELAIAEMDSAIVITHFQNDLLLAITAQDKILYRPDTSDTIYVDTSFLQPYFTPIGFNKISDLLDEIQKSNEGVELVYSAFVNEDEPWDFQVSNEQFAIIDKQTFIRKIREVLDIVAMNQIADLHLK